MQTIIGLGQAGCNIADHFSQYPQYNIIKIDTKLKKAKNTFNLKYHSNPEHYEKKLPVRLIKHLHQTVQSHTLFITSCGMVSGASLSILEKIKDKTQITVMYIIPHQTELVGDKKLQNTLLFNVFQEYARSALFERVYLLDNQKMSDIIGPVPIMKRWESLNNLIASTYHMINVFEHTQPILTTITNRIKTARISTLGLLDEENNEEIMFFKLDIQIEKNYYYRFPNKQLEENVSLMEAIQTNLKTNIEHDKMKITYSVYSTEYDKLLAYCEKSSTLIQKLAF